MLCGRARCGELRQVKFEELKAVLNEAVKLAATCGVDEEQLLNMLADQFKEAGK